MREPDNVRGQEAPCKLHTKGFRTVSKAPPKVEWPETKAGKGGVTCRPGGWKGSHTSPLITAGVIDWELLRFQAAICPHACTGGRC